MAKTFGEIRAAWKPRTLSEWVALDGDLIRRITELERELRRARVDDDRLNRDPAAPAIQQELDKARRQAEDAAVRFTFQALPRVQWRALIDQHPSDDPTWRWNEDTLRPAAVTACCIEPEGVDGQTIWNEWDEATAKLLGDMAISVNEVASKVPLSLTATGETNGSGSNSTTAPNVASLTASS